MALSIVKELLQNYVQSLFAEGIVNDQFSHIQTSKTPEEPDYVVKLISTYCSDVEAILSEMSNDCDHPGVDFPKLAALAQQIEERSSNVGAEHVRLACAGLIQACHHMDERNFSNAFNWIKREFGLTQDKLQVIVQMERKIMRLESKQ